jgi:hypothetical protein
MMTRNAHADKEYNVVDPKIFFGIRSRIRFVINFGSKHGWICLALD